MFSCNLYQQLFGAKIVHAKITRSLGIIHEPRTQSNADLENVTSHAWLIDIFNQRWIWLTGRASFWRSRRWQVLLGWHSNNIISTAQRSSVTAGIGNGPDMYRVREMSERPGQLRPGFNPCNGKYRLFPWAPIEYIFGQREIARQKRLFHDNIKRDCKTQNMFGRTIVKEKPGYL